jgi:hypothetical protein
VAAKARILSAASGQEKAELEHRRIGEGFAHVHVGGAGGDEADPAVDCRHQHVERRDFRFGAQRLLALEHQRDARLGAGRAPSPSAAGP